MLTIRFDDGTLLLEGAEHHLDLLGDHCVWDSRVQSHRAVASQYANILRLVHGKIPYRDEARSYRPVVLSDHSPKPLRPYQQEALQKWQQHKRRGVVVLPTGAGKSYVAVQAMLLVKRSTLVLVPTIDLVLQWCATLREAFNMPIGQYGGGERDLQLITVATYDSGVLIMPHRGHQFGLLVCDECHHLPSGVFRQVADCCIAPFRLGLTATPERSDGGHELFDELIGPEVYRTQITDLEGSYLANYQVEVLEVPLMRMKR